MGGKKRKHDYDEALQTFKKDDSQTRNTEKERKKKKKTKSKVLVTCSRPINNKYCHLMLNLLSLLPHCKKGSKIESKESKRSTLNELIGLRNCSSALFIL